MGSVFFRIVDRFSSRRIIQAPLRCSVLSESDNSIDRTREGRIARRAGQATDDEQRAMDR